MKGLMKRFYIIGLFLVILVALGIYAQFHLAQNTIRLQTKENLELKSSEVTNLIGGWLEIQGSVIRSTGNFIRVTDDEDRILSLLKEQLDENNIFFSIYFGTPENQMLNVSGWRPPQDYDLRTRPWYIGAIKENGLYYSETYQNASNDEYIVTIAEPIYDESGSLKGVVSGDVTLGEIINVVNNHKVSDNGYTFVVDRDGNVLSHPNYSKLTKSLPYKAIQINRDLEDVISINQSGFMNLNLEGVEGLAYYQKIPEIDWVIVSFIPEHDYLGVERRFIGVSIAVILLTLGSVLILINQQKREVIDPLIKLGNDIEKISIENKINYRLPENYKDTFNRTRGLLNEVLKKTQEYFEGLKDVQKELEMILFLLSRTEEMIFVLDENYEFVYGNQAFFEMIGNEKKEIREKQLIGEERVLEEHLLEDVRKIGHWYGERVYIEDGKNIHIFLKINRLIYDERTYYTVVFTDISQHKKNEMDLQYLKYYDPLTKLKNSVYFWETITELFNETSFNENQHALMLFNINRFRIINEVKGFSFGNELLKLFAERLGYLKEADDILVRMGDDEFAIIKPNVSDFDTLYSAVAKIYESMKKGYEIDKEDIFINLGIGISLYPTDGKTLADIYKSATTALGSLKSEETDGYRFYNKELNQDAVKNYNMQGRLRKALKEQNFVLYYQPQICFNDKKMVGVEALLRLEEDGKIILPNEFIHVAESSNLILPIGEWVLKEACKFSYGRYLEGHEFSVAVNISSLQFRNPYIINLVEAVLMETKLPPHLLQLEITEGILMENAEECGYIISKLKNRGITLSIDDFGTGYSSLAYLKKIDVNQLKIDRSFIKDIPYKDNGVIAKVILELADSFGMDVVAEGIENKKQEEFLVNIGCKTGQGYFYYKPMDEEGIKKLMNQWK